MQFDAQTINAIAAASPEIVRFIEAKAPREIGSWNELGGDEYARAFAVAGTTGQDVIGDIYGSLLQTMAQGGTEEDFAELVTPILKRKGWLPGPQGLANRVNLIYDTNLRVARAVGRWQRVQKVAHVMPYLQGQTVGDPRVREEHRAFQGIVLPVNHWFWQEFWPPLFFRCRCDVVQLTRSQFARRGLVITPDAEVEARAAQIRPQSWGYNVAIAGLRALEEKAAAVPGMPPVDVTGLQAQGRGQWNALMGLAVGELVTGLIRALGGGESETGALLEV